MQKQFKTHILAIQEEGIFRSLDHNPTSALGGEIVSLAGAEKLPFDVNDLWIGPRQYLETNPAFRQIIPYVIIERDGKFLTYRRTKDGGEARLHEKSSIGFGGHIELIDIELDQAGEAISLETTVLNTAMREISEELKLTDDNITMEVYGLLVDNTNMVGRVHLGIVMLARVKGMVTSGESQIDLTGFLPIEELRKEANLEGWSELVVKHISEHGLPVD